MIENVGLDNHETFAQEQQQRTLSKVSLEYSDHDKIIENLNEKLMILVNENE